MRSSSDLTREEYDEEVYFCLDCHSLAVVAENVFSDEEWDGSYCNNCFSTHISRCKFGEWLEEEERREAKKRELEWNR
jgi:hypothetical protein